MKRKLLLLYTLSLLSVTRMQAQDIHFSQFYASPLNLNPALTGINDGSYRVAGIYRNQDRSFTTPFVTYSASFDTKVAEKFFKSDVFGLGGTFVGDKSGDERLTMYSGMFSVSYHKSLGKNHNHYIGLGIQAGYTQKSLNYALAFPDQHINGNFDLAQSNGENFGKPKIGYFDMQFGILHQSWIKPGEIGIMTGFSMYHLTQPKESILGNNYHLQNRFTAHIGAYIRIVKHFYLTPNFLFQYQSKAKEFNIGTGFEYHLDTKKSPFIFSLGIWDRPGDAVIASAGIEYYHTRLLFAYDITTSSLKTATNSRSGFELALIFTGIIKSNNGVNYPMLVPCPRM